MSTQRRARIREASTGDENAASDFLTALLSRDIDTQVNALNEMKQCNDPQFWELALEFEAAGTWDGRTVPGFQPGEPPAERARGVMETQFERKGATEAVAAAQEQALLDGAQSDNPAIRQHAVYLLGIRGRSDNARQILEDALQDPVPGVREAAASALGKRGADSSIQALAKQLGNPDYGARHRARMQLTLIGEPALPALRDVMSHGGERYRWEAAKAAEGIGTSKSADMLAQALHDENPGVRGIAVEGLTALGKKSARPVLEVLRSHGSEAVTRSSAELVLTHLSHTGIYTNELKPVLEALQQIARSNWDTPARH